MRLVLVAQLIFALQHLWNDLATVRRPEPLQGVARKWLPKKLSWRTCCVQLISVENVSLLFLRPC